MPIPIKIGIIAGSGMDNPDIIKNRKELKVSTPFGDPSDVLILGEIDNVECVLLARHGRPHTIMPSNINYRANIWALKEQGCTHILASTATGSLQEHIKPGDVVIVDNFIDRTYARKQTFFDGESGHPKGICHIPLEPVYCQMTRQMIIDVAEELKIEVHKKGTVVTIEGPRFSSKAESNMYRLWGCDLVNMTTVPEVVLAKEAGILYTSIALATDYDCWRDTGDKVCVPDVLRIFKENISKVSTLIATTVSKIASQNWEASIKELKAMAEESVLLPNYKFSQTSI
ncbi:S-methyl-5'-thioadenosine phosphorylase [Anoplophora glabripennis]|nr:S-methyl-5'-thioadenosine phosphorylase [Anoplophora glabripennis]